MAETPRRPLPEELAFDLDAAVEAAREFLRVRLETAALDRYVVGLSGGVDSACSAALAARAVGPDRILSVKMPSQTSASASQADAEAVEALLGIPAENRLVVPVGPIVAGWQEATGERPETISPVRVGNVAARARMVVLWDQAWRVRGTVLGTENRTEELLGYFTIYGDAGTAVEPISPFYKTQVWRLAEHLGLPEQVIGKAPTADLWAGQTDEGELGVRYADADRVLYWVVDRGLSASEAESRTGLSGEVVGKVLARYRATQFKRELPYHLHLH